MHEHTSLHLRQAASWCIHTVSNGYAMRSPSLRPNLLSSDDPLTQLYAIHDNQDQLPVAVTDVCTKRSALLKELNLALPALDACTETGNFYCTDFDTDSCAAATEPSYGFFNDCDIPGWDSWFAYEATDGLGRIYGWVPKAMYNAVNAGIIVIPVESVWWVEAVPDTAT